MKKIITFACAAAFCLPATAQTPQQATDAAAQVENSSDELLTAEELQTLVAPVALYPDTLLIQIFVAATQPLEIVKAERFLLDNAGRDAAELEPEIEAMGWDPSVTVLATAFPEIVGQMATHIDWTETVGTAMLAQSDDVLDAVQVMRDLAIESGALVSGAEQTVEVTEDEEVIITPTDPEIVYVPEYVPTEVYSGPSAGDVLGATLLTFGIVAVIDEIFDDNDDWYDYWGCRNCGGWGGGPIIRDPDIDIDVDGNVNIGNEIDLGDRMNVDRDNIDLENRPDIGWTPDSDRAQEAREKIANRQPPETGQTRLPVDRPEGRSDQLREQLSAKTGAADISRPTTQGRAGQVAVGAGAGAAAGAALANRGNSGNAENRLPQIDRGNISGERANAKAEALAKTREPPVAAKPQVKSKPKVTKKPQVQSRPGNVQRKPSASKGAAMKKKSSGGKARSASARGKGAKAKLRR
ncbi:MAG: DUF3300 domain-containing protein [Dinoroseobacter sp.]|nr:DUF3300 domain-containing protein [Dinoroseobacter sp.]